MIVSTITMLYIFPFYLSYILAGYPAIQIYMRPAWEPMTECGQSPIPGTGLVSIDVAPLCKPLYSSVPVDYDHSVKVLSLVMYFPGSHYYCILAAKEIDAGRQRHCSDGPQGPFFIMPVSATDFSHPPAPPFAASPIPPLISDLWPGA